MFIIHLVPWLNAWLVCLSENGHFVVFIFNLIKNNNIMLLHWNGIACHLALSLTPAALYILAISKHRSGANKSNYAAVPSRIHTHIPFSPHYHTRCHFHRIHYNCIVVIIDGKIIRFKSKSPIWKSVAKRLSNKNAKDKTILLPNTLTEPNLVFHLLRNFNCLEWVRTKIAFQLNFVKCTFDWILFWAR